MIQFTYEHPKNNDYEGVLTVHVHETASQYYSKEQFPLRLMHKTLMGEIPWHSDLQPGWWSQYTMLTYTTLEVIDNLGNKLIDWKWDPFTHGDIAHQMFEIWSMNNRGSNGIAIGTHNGMTGEWVGPINKGLIKGTLVEASDPQYKDLHKYYNNKTWVKCRQELITTDGSDVIFYEGGGGWTNSIVKESIENYVDSSLIRQTNRTSISINSLIEEVSIDGPVKWLHLDVEGLDDKLILSIKEELLPELLVYENENIGDESNDMVRTYLESKGYIVHNSNRNVIALRNN
jgi:hypothetical protein